MPSYHRPRTRARTLAAWGGTALLVAALAVAAGPPASAAGLCATPGGSGAGGTLSGVVNTYYPTTGSVAPGATSIPVGSSIGAGASIAPGDLLLVIQMQDADFDSSNTDSYGHGGAAAAPAAGYTDLNGTGQYEYVVATSGVSGGTVGVAGTGPGGGLVNGYTDAAATSTSGRRTYQVVVVPQYTTATTSSGLTAAAWDGSAGGVLALDTTGVLTLAGTVSVDGLGFRGGAGIQRGGSGAAGLANTDVAVSATLGVNGTKGEGVAGTPLGTTAGNGYPGGDTARGAPGNAGGGGTDGRPSNNDENSGGGGGGNGGAGGQGGNTWNSALSRGGYGGVDLPANAGRVFLGGGGGAGTANNFPAPAAAGAPGGGIVLVRAGSVTGSGTFSADGADAYNDTQNDGGGGGGAGGTILLTAATGSLAAATLRADGGRGGNAWATQGGAASAHGPGGGGGGGWILTSTAPSAGSVGGGGHGITTSGNLVYGSTDGDTGQAATIDPGDIPGVSGGGGCADVSVTKSGPATAVAGSTISYPLTVANDGPADAEGVEVTDTLPPGTEYVSATGAGWSCTPNADVDVTCTRASLASGASSTITVEVTAPSEAGDITNSVEVTADTPDPDPTNNADDATTTVTAAADLSITKAGPADVRPGGSIRYTIRVTNDGPSDAADVTVTDTLPADATYVSASGTGWTCAQSGTVLTCDRAALAAGATAPPIRVLLTAPDHGADLTNAASVTSSTPDPDSSDNSDSVTTTVGPSADLSVVKTGPGVVEVGDRVDYQIIVSNAGPDAADAVTVVDTLPASSTFVAAGGVGWTCVLTGSAPGTVTCVRPTLAAGATAPPIHVAVTAPPTAGSITNAVRVSTQSDDPVDDNNAASAATTVRGPAGGSLPGTGSDGLGSLLLVGMSLVAIGGVLLARRPHRPRRP